MDPLSDRRLGDPMFVHLHCHSPYSFLDGVSSIRTYLEKAADYKMPALALTDHCNISGAVEFHKIAHEYGIKPIQGAEITTPGGYHLTLLAENSKGYENLCRLLTTGFVKHGAAPTVSWSNLALYHQGLLALSGCRRSELVQAIVRRKHSHALEHVQKLIQTFGNGQVYLEMTNTYLPRTKQLLKSLFALHEHTKVPLIATNNVHYANKLDYRLHDVLACVRTLTKLADIHPARPLNGENYFASPKEMQQRFSMYPQAVVNTLEVARRCDSALPLGRNLFPKFLPPAGFKTAQQFLRHLVQQGAIERYGKLTPNIEQRLNHELTIIEKLHVVDYFLVVWDIVQYAKANNIRYAGRGSAADSAVAYCLKITNVDAIGRSLLFERFLSLERAQKPDIDIDFDAQKRDQVANYVYEKYGEKHVASVCTFSTYHARSSLRDLGKAWGFPEQELRMITKNIPQYIPADGIRKTLAALPELENHPLHLPKYQELLDFCQALTGHPRHMGTHLGGLVVSGPELTTISPLQPSAKGVMTTQFDKNTIEDLGLIKLDLLSLRTLSAVSEVDTQLAANKAVRYDQIPLDDQATYQMLNKGDTVGVFQLESPAQRNLQSRLQADNIEDLVASVALIRPGPIKGNMVEPYLTRRHGLEQPSYIHPKLEPILRKTYGVVLFQEQVIEIATEIAGFTPGESDRLRRVMTKFRSQVEMDAIGEEFIRKAINRGIDAEIAQTIFSYIVGYAGYGFCEAHAAAFSDTAYKTAYLLRHHPAQFYAALLNHQPMGFYPPNTLCVQARRANIAILPLDINCSEDRVVATASAIRIGLNQVKGMEPKFIMAILTTRAKQKFHSLAEFIYRTTLPKDILENLILAGAFDAFCANRRSLLWKLPNYMKNRQGSLFFAEDSPGDYLADFSPWQRWAQEFQVLQLSATTHIMDFYRTTLQARGVLTSKDAMRKDQGTLTVAGLVIRPHRPPTRSGRVVVFLTLEDEHGLFDVTIFEDVYHRYAKQIFQSPLLLISGEVTRRDGHEFNIIAKHITPLPLKSTK